LIRFILATTSAGQLVQLDKRFLDPRRPMFRAAPRKCPLEDRDFPKFCKRCNHKKGKKEGSFIYCPG